VKWFQGQGVELAAFLPCATNMSLWNKKTLLVNFLQMLYTMSEILEGELPRSCRNPTRSKLFSQWT
jgi:hypothetical protein